MNCYLSLPHFYLNKTFNNALFRFIKQNLNSRKFDFEIESFYGSYPFVSWNGDTNSNYIVNNFLPTHKNFFNFNNDSSCVIRYDMTNYYINSNDFEDIHSNIILKLTENGANQIEIANLELYNYLQNKYPYFNFVFNDKFLKKDLDRENIDTLFKDYEKIILYHHNDRDSEINNKLNIEILVGLKCSCPKDNRLICNLKENLYQMEFSENSIYNCEKINQYNNFDLENELRLYSLKGYKHFKIDSPPISKLENFNKYIIKNLLKPEYETQFWNFYKKMKRS